MDTDTRTDGLAITEATRTIRYIAGRAGVELEQTLHRRGGREWPGRLRGRGSRTACEQIADIMRLHGFATVVVDDSTAAVIDVDPASCPVGATPGERLQLAERLADEDGRDARAQWLDFRRVGEAPGYGDTAGDAYKHAADSTYLWCEQHTLPFLRRLAELAPVTHVELATRCHEHRVTQPVASTSVCAVGVSV